MKVLAIITARGGSKRIPRKNIKDFLGKPIIAYSIEAALGSAIFSDVMVSTDDDEIASIAKEYGAQIPFMRSADNANDMAMTAPVVLEVLDSYKKIGKTFDYVCCIYPTAPFINSTKLQDAFTKLKECSADSVIPVVRFGFPIQRALMINVDKLEMIEPENLNVRSQDLRASYHDSGQFYFLKVSSFLEHRQLFMPNTAALEIPESEVQDIDTEEDWKVAELKYRILNNFRFV